MRTHTTRLGAPLAAVLTAVAACSAEQTAEPTPAPPDETGEAPAEAAEPEEPEGIDFTGIVAYERMMMAETGTLRTYDHPEDLCSGGAPRTEITVPRVRGGESFSPDWEYLATSDYDSDLDSDEVFDDQYEGGFTVYRLASEAEGYEPVFEVMPEESGYFGSDEAYSRPRFSPDGETLWFQVLHEGTITLASIPYTDVTTTPEFEMSGLEFPENATGIHQSYAHPNNDTRWAFDGDGEPVLTLDEEAQGLQDDEELSISETVGGRYWENDDGAVAHLRTGLGMGREAEHRIGEREFLLSNTRGNLLEERGVISRFTVHGDGTFDMEPLVSVGAEEKAVFRMVVSTDGQEVVFALEGDDEEVYRASLEDSSEPEKLGEGGCDLHLVLEWTR